MRDKDQGVPAATVYFLADEYLLQRRPCPSAAVAGNRPIPSRQPLSDRGLEARSAKRRRRVE